MKSFAELNKPTDYNAIPQDSMSSLVNFIKNKGKILLIGPTGSCKTSAVYAIANGLDLEVIEVNASDIRNKEGIERTVGSSANQRSLFSKERIVLIDEIDALSGMEDRGGAQAIASIIKSSSCCIVMTANEKDNEKITFTKLLPPRAGKQEKVHTFIPLLHLENQEKVEMEQQQHFEEIYITLTKKNKAS